MSDLSTKIELTISEEALMQALCAANAATLPLINSVFGVDVPSNLGRRLAEEILARAKPSPAGTSAMRQALEECVEVLALVEHPRRVDPQYGDEIRSLGDRIGYGALMSSASASWRQYLADRGCPTGAEFVAGPCYGTVVKALEKARRALAFELTVPPTEAKPQEQISCGRRGGNCQCTSVEECAFREPPSRAGAEHA